MRIPFTKMHGLGNDFVVIDAGSTAFQPVPALLARLADRHFGVGCDQILVIDPAPAAGIDFGYRIYNADGSESGQCLNGSRCVARYVRDRGLSAKPRIRVQTVSTQIELETLSDGQVRVDAGPPRFSPADIPLMAGAAALHYTLQLADASTLRFGAVGIGNPHAVIEVADVDTAAVAEIGAALQNHPMFPQRVNVGFLQVVDQAHARLRVFERGAGETLACGSGACAAMVLGRIWGRLNARAEIEVRGGSLQLEWAGRTLSDDSSVWLTGPAETVFEGSLEWPS